MITAYDEADVLRATIEAYVGLEHPYDELEVVVCYESASNDGMAAIAEAAADRHRRVRAIERPGPPAGKASALNYALSRASGELLVNLDADQRLEPRARARRPVVPRRGRPVREGVVSRNERGCVVGGALRHRRASGRRTHGVLRP